MGYNRHIRKKQKRDNSKILTAESYEHYRYSQICFKMLLGTLEISDQVVHTMHEKLSDEGNLKKDKRGGRPKCLEEEDDRLKKEAVAHINKFQTMESNHCGRRTSTNGYMSADLNNSTIMIYVSWKIRMEFLGYFIAKRSICEIDTVFHQLGEE